MMIKEKGFLEDVGIRELPFPVRVTSRVDSDGQPTIANISIAARIERLQRPYGRIRVSHLPSSLS